MVPGTTSLILDLGFSELLARRFGGHVIGIDPSEGMLQQVSPELSKQPGP
jgi:ubiquinone/menaquinone biosynthesis C-methylase UbiE